MTSSSGSLDEPVPLDEPAYLSSGTHAVYRGGLSPIIEAATPSKPRARSRSVGPSKRKAAKLKSESLMNVNREIVLIAPQPRNVNSGLQRRAVLMVLLVACE